MSIIGSVDRYRYLIVDFYCHQLKLIVEIDGPIHQGLKENDEERERLLISMGYKIKRFTNQQVLSQWNDVENQLRQAAQP